MSISGIGSSKSIYGNRNIISGLASGMDTESMIENAVSGLKTKITSLQQQRTRTEWQQDAYRSIISKLSAFSEKYTSYRSSTNLMSSSFFNSAVTVKSQGANAANVSASGRTNSEIEVLGVKNLAKTATYNVSLGGTQSPSITGDMVNLDETMELSNISGTMTLNYGKERSYTIEFGDQEIYKSAEEFAAAINEKLSAQTMNLSDGKTAKVSERMGARVVDGKVELFDKVSNNGVYISSASGDLKDTLGLSKVGTDVTSIDVSGKDLYSKDTKRVDYLKRQEMSFTVDGVTKKIKLDNIDSATGSTTADKVKNALQEKLDRAFGKDKVTVSNDAQPGYDSSFKLEAKPGSSILVTGGAALGLESTDTSYITTGKTLGSVGAWKNIDWSTGATTDGSIQLKKAMNADGTEMKDSNGKQLYEFEINGTVIGNFNQDTEVGTLMNAINGSEDAGVSVTYSKTTNNFQFKAKTGGEAGNITISDGLAAAMFGKLDPTNVQAGQNYTEGKDAELRVSINGMPMDLKRSSNSFEIDGLTLNLKREFNYDAANEAVNGGYGTSPDQKVTFESSADADKIVDAIKSMVNDYNEMATEIKKAYSTLPATKSNGSFANYMPLTDEDKEGMSESAIAAYEEKAKQGILFGDRDLSQLYQRMTRAISLSGKDGDAMREIGLEIAYSNGQTTFSLNETKLRAALESDPDKVRDLFSKSKDSGASSDGLMTSLKAPIDQYGKTTGGKGVLVELAGSPLASSTLYSNTIQKKLDNFDTQISKWQDKINTQIDRYTSQFTRLEQLINQMNSQSSALANFMGMGN